MTDLKEIRNEVLGDSYYEVKHPSGLTIYVYPKPGYSSTYAIFGTGYGSIDNFIKTKGTEARPIPEGTAHYLEHKLFESEELDAFELFAKTGANANAYTSFDRTCFLFSCSGSFKENLEILLDFVQHPYFTEETVQKEQGIIGQEIRMYQDEPSWQVFFNLLRGLYQKHSIKIDIAGTQESISHNTADLLYDCYNTFYNPSNMVLAVAGNASVDEVLEVVEANLMDRPSVDVEREDVKEPKEPASPYIEEKFSVARPIMALGFKEDHETPVRSLEEMLIADVLLDYIAGDTSPLYCRLLDEGLINHGFGYEYFYGFGYACVIFEGETKDPQRLSEEIKKEIRRVKKEGLDPAEFERVRKANYGKAIMDYNDVDGLANELVAAHLEGFRLFDELEVYRRMTVADAEKQLASMMNEKYSSMSVVLPKEE